MALNKVVIAHKSVNAVSFLCVFPSTVVNKVSLSPCFIDCYIIDLVFTVTVELVKKKDQSLVNYG